MLGGKDTAIIKGKKKDKIPAFLEFNEREVCVVDCRCSRGSEKASLKSAG